MSNLEVASIGHLGLGCATQESAVFVDPFVEGTSSLRPLQLIDTMDPVTEARFGAVALTGLSANLADYRSLERLLPGRHLLGPQDVIKGLPLGLRSQAAKVTSCEAWTPHRHGSLRFTFTPGAKGYDWGVLIQSGNQCVWNLGNSLTTVSICAKVATLIEAPQLAWIDGSFHQNFHVASRGPSAFPYDRLRMILAQAKLLSQLGWADILIHGGLYPMGRASWKQHFEWPIPKEKLLVDLRNHVPGQRFLSPECGMWTSTSGEPASVMNPLAIKTSSPEVLFDPTIGIPPILADGTCTEAVPETIKRNLSGQSGRGLGEVVDALTRWQIVIELREVSSSGTRVWWIAPKDNALIVCSEEPTSDEQLINQFIAAFSASGLQRFLSGTATAERLALEDHLRISSHPFSLTSQGLQTPTYHGALSEKSPSADQSCPLPAPLTTISVLAPGV